MNCVIHNEKEATGACTYCGKLYCADCLVEINGRNYCREHVNEALNQTSNNSSPTIIINNDNNNHNTNNNMNFNGGISISSKSRLLCLLLAIFVGYLGIHRFYAGKIGSGILYLCTAGFCGVGVLIDIISILLGSFRDNYGFPITNWNM